MFFVTISYDWGVGKTLDEAVDNPTPSDVIATLDYRDTEDSDEECLVFGIGATADEAIIDLKSSAREVANWEWTLPLSDHMRRRTDLVKQALGEKDA